ncbi:MAG: prepilin-type N-terminal cleavage/methylation domain-containing protein [Zoogloeaceae bacterium]|nr:prepilin-type N-terminal cleavage/methylation domain-containing protein [Zoogloeaceae bacterium]
MRRATDPRQRGVTLVEMIIAIVITGILVSMASMFGRWQIQSYFDVSSRAALADAGDTALRRMARELQDSLPNSVRVSGNFLEFVPIRDAGRYRAESGGGAGDDPLDFGSSTDNTFDVFGPTVNIAAGEQLVIYNLGLAGSDVYAGTSRRAATAGTGLSKVTFAPAGTQFPFPSPRNRFHVVGQPMTFECAPNAGNPALGVVRMRWNYGFLAAQPVLPASFGAGSSAVLVSGVASCAITYAPGALQRNGLVSIRLALANDEGSERIELLHQVDVVNSP